MSWLLETVILALEVVLLPWFRNALDLRFWGWSDRLKVLSASEQLGDASHGGRGVVLDARRPDSVLGCVGRSAVGTGALRTGNKDRPNTLH
jgi:hypothetical protein